MLVHIQRDLQLLHLEVNATWMVLKICCSKIAWYIGNAMPRVSIGTVWVDSCSRLYCTPTAGDFSKEFQISRNVDLNIAAYFTIAQKNIENSIIIIWGDPLLRWTLTHYLLRVTSHASSSPNRSADQRQANWVILDCICNMLSCRQSRIIVCIIILTCSIAHWYE